MRQRRLDLRIRRLAGQAAQVQIDDHGLYAKVHIEGTLLGTVPDSVGGTTAEPCRITLMIRGEMWVPVDDAQVPIAPSKTTRWYLDANVDGGITCICDDPTNPNFIPTCDTAPGD